MNLDYGIKVFHPAFTCSNSAKRNIRNRSNILKVYNKDTRTTSCASIVNFEHDLHFILVLLLLNLDK